MKNAIDILVDISDKMEGNGKPFAQRVLLEEILPMVDFSETTGLKTFMASGPVCLVIRSVVLGNNSKSDFEQKINSLPMPNSGAPISNAIRESVNELNNQPVDAKHMVIVTAGVDTLAGSYVNAAKEAAAAGIKLSVVLIGADASAISVANDAVAAAGGVVCCVDGNAYDSIAVRNELAKLDASLKGQAAPKVEEPVAPAQPVVEVVEKPATTLENAIHEKLETESVIDIDELKESIHEDETPVFEPIKVEDIPATETEEEKVDLAAIIAKNQASLKEVQQKSAACISAMMDSCSKAIAELQEKTAAKIADLVKEYNASSASLMKNSADAFDKLSAQKDAALAKVDQLIADDKAVVIRTDNELADKIELKSQQYLNGHLQKKYPGRVKWMNEKGDALKGYDFVVDDFDNNNGLFEYVISCKGILDNSKTFFMRQREWEACVKNARNYQVYVVSNLQDTPSLTIIDNLMDAIASGKVVPCTDSNVKLKAGHVVLSFK